MPPKRELVTKIKDIDQFTSIVNENNQKLQGNIV